MASRVLDKKLKKVLEMRTDTPALLESLDAISALINNHCGSSNASSRRRIDGGGGGGEEAAGGGAAVPSVAGSQGYTTIEARRSLREDLERQVGASGVNEW